MSPEDGADMLQWQPCADRISADKAATVLSMSEVVCTDVRGPLHWWRAGQPVEVRKRHNDAVARPNRAPAGHSLPQLS